MMFGEFFRTVGTGQKSKPAIFGSRVIKGDPDGACRERSDRPILAILMPWRLTPDFRWFREEARIPLRNVRPDQLPDHVQNRVVSREIQKSSVMYQ